jgi:hypothetical protein
MIIITTFAASIMYPYGVCSLSQLTPPSTRRMRMYATPQKMKPKKESKRELMRDRREEKNGITC